MTQSNKVSLAIAALFVIVAAILMIDGQNLGEMTTNLSRVLLVTALPVIATSRKKRTELESQSVQV
ncbi:MAG: hypothetical protein ACXAEF_05900 [Candidatus Thorarchaeota archaeon]|jgi:hypothetical protein